MYILPGKCLLLCEFNVAETFYEQLFSNLYTVYVYVHIYIYMYTYINIYMFTRICIYTVDTCIYIYIHVNMYTYTYMYITRLEKNNSDQT